MNIEQKLAAAHAALKRIASYDTPARLQRHSDRDWGLPFEEAIAMAYENIQGEAKQALRTIGRLPKPKVIARVDEAAEGRDG